MATKRSLSYTHLSSSPIYTKLHLMCQNGQASMRNTLTNTRQPQPAYTSGRWAGTTRDEPHCDEYIQPVHNTPLFSDSHLPPPLPFHYPLIPKHKQQHTHINIHTNTHRHTHTVVHIFYTYFHQPVEEDSAHAGKDSWV